MYELLTRHCKKSQSGQSQKIGKNMYELSMVVKVVKMYMINVQIFAALLWNGFDNKVKTSSTPCLSSKLDYRMMSTKIHMFVNHHILCVQSQKGHQVLQFLLLHFQQIVVIGDTNVDVVCVYKCQ